MTVRGFSITLEDGLGPKLEALAKADQRRILRPVMRRSVAPAQKVARTYAPFRSGALRKAVRVSVKYLPRTGRMDARVGIDGRVQKLLDRKRPPLEFIPHSGFKRYGKRRWAKRTKVDVAIPRYYAHLVELGHKGGAKPHPFIGLAFRLVQDRMLREFATGVAAEYRKVMERSQARIQELAATL